MRRGDKGQGFYRLGDIVDHDGTVGVAVVHRSQGLVSLLTGSIPNLELDCSTFIERDGLSKERGTDGRLPIIVELILTSTRSAMRHSMSTARFESLCDREPTLTNRRTSELC
jgi:hypothetical protein